MVLKLTDGADSAQADDALVLKTTIVNWLTEVEAQNPCLSPYNKSDCGFYSGSTGRLLCPVEYNWENPE